VSNLDEATVRGFGAEWKAFDQSGSEESELLNVFQQYFAIFPWGQLSPRTAVGADFGCGSGRWSRLLASRVGHLHLIDASEDALAVAKKNLHNHSNVTFHRASVEEANIDDQSLDFAFSLGVLHHVPDTRAAMAAIATKLKPGAPFLVYLYYRFDNKPAWYQGLWQVSDLFRRAISRLPFSLRWMVSQLFALGVYWPLARTAAFLETLDALPGSFPLAFYRQRSFYVMRTDALDRFGTRVEHRYSKEEIRQMLEASGFERITFSDEAPYWCAVGYRL
jgi:ubiquinone/menaquinone biosynthesis C-methylase UbiE